MADNPIDSLRFFEVASDPPSSMRALAIVSTPIEPPEQFMRLRCRLFAVVDSSVPRWGYWELELPKEQMDPIMRDVVRDIVHDTFFSKDDRAAVIEERGIDEVVRLAQRGRGREALEAVRSDRGRYPVAFRAMAEIALTAMSAKFKRIPDE